MSEGNENPRNLLEEEFVLPPEKLEAAKEDTRFEIPIERNELEEDDSVIPSLKDWKYAEELVKKVYLNAGHDEQEWAIYPSKNAAITKLMEDAYRSVRATSLSLWDKYDEMGEQGVEQKRNLYQAALMEQQESYSRKPKGEEELREAGELSEIEEIPIDTSELEAKPEPEPAGRPVSEVPGAGSGMSTTGENTKPELSSEQQLRKDVFAKYRDMLKELQRNQKQYDKTFNTLLEQERERRAKEAA
jgi:hypothetical protein